MQQLELVHDDFDAAMKTLVQALGGVSKVAQDLRPTVNDKRAATWLSNALDPDRDEKLSSSDYVYLLREGRRRGIHVATAYLLREIGYHDPVPKDPVDERAELEKAFIRAKEDFARIMRRMEDLS